MAELFPRTEVGGISLPRMLIGTNWLLGWSHRSAAADKMIRERYDSYDKMLPVFEAYLQYGIDAVMAPASTTPIMADAVKYAEDKLQHKFILIDTPALNVEDTPEGRKIAENQVKHSAEIGSTFCLIHHVSTEQRMNKLKREITGIKDYLYMIREAGMKPGFSAHMPEVVQYSDANDYDVETYIQIFNCMGFLLQVEVASVARIIQKAKHPVMTIKPFAAGRCTPFVGFNFNWNVLRPCEMITVGAGTVDEVHEDVEISFAASERRAANIGGRSSPFAQAVLGHKQ